MEELAHRGDQCGFGSQAFAQPALVEALQDRVVSHSDQSRHVQGLAQPTVALLADPGLATDGGAGLVEHGIEARIAGQLPRRGVRQLVSILGQQRQGSQRPDAGDGDEQVKARPQRALCSRQGERLGLDLGELARQPVGQLAEPLDQSDRDVRVDLGLLVAIAQSVEQLAQLELVAPQGPKLERDRGGLRAGRRLERFGELQETLRIDDVGLARARCRTGEVADPPRIGQDIAHPGPALPQPSFELAPVRAGRLEHHADPRAPRQPSAKQRQPRRVVGELLGDALALLPAGRHERRLREIHANPGDSGHLAPPCRPTSVRLQLSRGRCLPSSSRLLRLGYGPASRGRSIFLTGSTASRGSQRLIPAAPRHEPLPPRGSSTSPKILERAWGVEPSSAELWARRPQSAAPASTTGASPKARSEEGSTPQARVGGLPRRRLHYAQLVTEWLTHDARPRSKGASPMHKKVDVYRAWRDGEYFEGLSEEERARLPEGPVGAIQLSDEALRAASGLSPLTTHQSWCYNSACLTHCSCLC